MNRIINVLSTVFFVSVFFNCQPLKKIVNNNFPPLTVTDQQYASVERSMQDMEGIAPDVGVHIQSEFIVQYAVEEIKKAVDTLRLEEVTVKKFVPKLSFDKQGIFLEADFVIAVPTHKAEIKGTFLGATSAGVEGDKLFLLNAIKSLKVHSIKFGKGAGIGRRAAAKALVPILKNYMDNINGYFLRKPVIIDIAWGEAYDLKIAEIFKDPNTEVIADPVRLERFIKKTAIRIKSNGISVLLELSGTKPVPESASSIPTERRTTNELSKLFKVYDEKYDSSWLHVFEPIEANAYVAVSISKAEIASLVNEALSKPVMLKQKFKIPQSSFNEKLEVKRGDIDCQQVRTKFDYPDFNGDACDWNCMKTVTVGVCPFCKKVKVEDPVCAASKTACKVKRETERIAWQTARETARIAHQAENEAKVAACNIQREAMDFMALGRIKGNVEANGDAEVSLEGFTLQQDLSDIAIRYSGGVNGKLKSKIELDPVDLGHIFFCLTGYNKRTDSDVRISIPSNTSNITVNALQEGENLNLKIQLPAVNYYATINPSPLHSMLLDPQFAVKCPIHTLLGIATVGTAAAKLMDMVKLAPEQELLLMGQVKGQYEIGEINIPFKPIVFTINNKDPKKSFIAWKSNSVRFSYYKPEIQVARH